MSRFFKFAFSAIFALVAFVAVARAGEKFYDEDGNELKVFDSGVGDDDWREEHDKRSFDVRGKSSFGMSRRHQKYKSVLFTHGPEKFENIWSDNVKITWYASNDLKQPACCETGWDPENHHHIGAVMKGWKNGPSCGDFVRLCNEKTNKCTKVRIVDECAGCKENHVDLTKSAFKRLATTGTLDEGITTGLKMFSSRMPNPWDLALFGPVKLKI